LEDRFPARSFDEIQDPKGIIVLGGAFNAYLTRARGPIALGAAGARVTEALALAHYFPKAGLVFSGGSADLLGNGTPESDIAEEFFLQLGLPTDRLTIERKSRNTSENALFTFEFAKPKPGEIWILVTSAVHMPRAVASFEKAGFQLDPYPVDYFTYGDLRDYWAYTFAPLKSLRVIDIAVKEWVGLTAYWIFGKTTAFLPGRTKSPSQN
jgi:uncharacterized SAM-binding protein YcdF (DUF218 family)